MAYNRRGYGMTTYMAVGDPFLGGLIKGAGKFLGGVAKTAGGIIGGPVGGVLQGVGGIIAPTRAAPQVPVVSRPYGGSIGISTPVGFGGTLGVNVGAARYTGVPIPMMAPNGGMAGPSGNLIPKGYRYNKSGYFLKTGQYIHPGTKLVKIRHRNVANGKALRSAVSRCTSFDKLVKRNRKNLRALARI